MGALSDHLEQWGCVRTLEPLKFSIKTHPFSNRAALTSYAWLCGVFNLLHPQLLVIGNGQAVFKESPREVD